MNLFKRFSLILFSIIFLLSFLKCKDFNSINKAESNINKVIQISSPNTIDKRDSLRVYEVINGENNTYLSNIFYSSQAYFYKDSLLIQINVGFISEGYLIKIKVFNEEYSVKFSRYGCSLAEILTIKEQHLQFEDFNLIHGGKLKGSYYCEAYSPTNFKGHKNIDQVIVDGFFEIIVLDEEVLKQSFE